jgi:hypothetical protein
MTNWGHCRADAVTRAGAPAPHGQLGFFLVELGINPQPAVILRLLNQASPHWILSDVLAFQLQAFV